MNIRWLKGLVAVATVLFVCGPATEGRTDDGRPDKPNVVLILADDLGWQDVKCYDIDEPSSYETPNIDQLAREGVKFWQAYSPAPTCAPSRGSILAGKHPARLQRTHVVGGAPPIPQSEKAWPVISPWYSGRLPVKEIIIPEALKANGYVSGHVGKWHIAINHHAFPQPKDHGFDCSESNLGVTRKMTPHRLAGFATTAKNDPFRLDENGFPCDQNNIDALEFIQQSKDKPFFLYYATWLVHAPIQSRSEALFRKYCAKMGVPYPKDPKVWNVKGQNNPYYAAMVEMLDYYVGQVLGYLKTTGDPRWPGHRLVENTYIIFTSDNGGMEEHPGEIITDNYPLDKGKIHAKEGGIRVPLIITGPGIPVAQESNVMVNGMDFYPTILSWTGTDRPGAQLLDGADLSRLLSQNPQDQNLVVDADGKVRDSMMHHFPNSASMHSTLRVGDYKVIRNFNPTRVPLELYRLYKNGTRRVDIEEMKNLAGAMPEKARQMDRLLQEKLEEMDAGFPYLNPYCSTRLAHKEGACKVLAHGRQDREVWLTYGEQGNKVVRADLLYTTTGGQKYEEWYRAAANIEEGSKVSAVLPEGTTHYLFNLIDEHKFLVSHPRMGGMNDYKHGNYSTRAFAVE
ncbi:MAG: sulfatase [Kiritimatiellales bacterium]|nr:sulfatase [Kiritimatiellales bacterium]